MARDRTGPWASSAGHNVSRASCSAWLAGWATASPTSVAPSRLRPGRGDPVKGCAGLVRPWRLARAPKEGRRARAGPRLSRRPRPQGSGSRSCVMTRARSAKAPLQGGSWATVWRCCCTHLTKGLGAASTSRCHPSWRACGASQSPSSAACKLACPNSVTPAGCRMTAGARPVTWLAHTTHRCMARPSQCPVSSPRPAPRSGQESTAARRGGQPHCPLALASSTVRATS
jgi:hypothetical protein